MNEVQSSELVFAWCFHYQS